MVRSRVSFTSNDPAVMSLCLAWLYSYTTYYVLMPCLALHFALYTYTLHLRGLLLNSMYLQCTLTLYNEFTVEKHKMKLSLGLRCTTS